MRDLDQTDLDILRLLLEDARRPYSEIAERVGVSPPTVSDRVDRLQKAGVIQRFTLDLDRTTLNDGTPVLVDVDLSPEADGAADSLASAGEVERVFESTDGRLVAEATVAEADIRPMLDAAVGMENVDGFDVHLLHRSTWDPQFAGPEVDIDYESGDLEAPTPR
jgi:DNA-binding Lrp family transcriptional regulator